MENKQAIIASHLEQKVFHLVGEVADELGVELTRAATPNADPRYARLAVELMAELRDGREPARVLGTDPAPGHGFSVDGAPCALSCPREL